MRPPLHRILLIVVLISIPFEFLAYSKTSKKNEKDELAFATFSGQPAPSDDLLKVLLRQARWDSGHWDLVNQMVLSLRFVKVDDQVTPKGTFARYRVFAVGAPENKIYEWGVWLDGEEPKSEPGDIYVNSRGLLMTRRPAPEEESSLQVPGAEFYVTPEAANAQPFRYGLHSRDNALSVLGTLVPKPVFAEDHGCKLEVRIAQPNTSAVLFIADGLPTDSKIQLVMQSESETVNVMMNSDSGGHAVGAGFPYVKAKTQGVLRATVEGPDCLPSVSLPWQMATQPAPKTP